MRRVIHEQLTGKQWLALTAELNGMPQDENARQLASNRLQTHARRAPQTQGRAESAGFGADGLIEARES